MGAGFLFFTCPIPLSKLMLEWIPLVILLIIIASVVILVDKKKVSWDAVVKLVIILWIVIGLGSCLTKMDEFSPSHGGFWFYLVIVGLLVLLLWRFWVIQAGHEKMKKQEKETKRLEEEFGAMFCRNCGKELIGSPEFCPNCGARPMRGDSFCSNCGAPKRR